MPRAFCLVLGTRGDAQPAALVAAALAARDDWSLTLFTHAAHKDWLAAPLRSSGISAVWLNAPPATCWNTGGGQVEAGRKRGRGVEGGSVVGQGRQSAPTGLGPYREELVQCVEAAIGCTLPLLPTRPPTTAAPPRLPHVVMANFLCLEGYHLAEAMGSALVMLSPYQVPYGCPSSFARRFSSAFPDLHIRLTTQEGDEEGEARQGSGPVATSWSDVEHWMWPLFLETWGPWRAARLGLPPLPCTDRAGEPLARAPHAPLVLYGYSKLLAPEPGYWPSHFRTCGFWLPDGSDSAWDEPPSSATEGIGADMVLLRDALLAADRRGCADGGTEGAPLPLLLVDFGSMGRMGLVPSPHTFIAALLAVLQEFEFRGAIILSGGWTPMEEACRAAVASSADAAAPVRLCCLKTFPHHRLLPACAAVLHHGGSGTTGAALNASCPQIICPFQFDQFFWAERMSWLGLAAEPLSIAALFGNDCDTPNTRDRDSSSLETATAVLRSALQVVVSSSTRRDANQMGESLRSEDHRCGSPSAFAADCVVDYFASSRGNKVNSIVTEPVTNQASRRPAVLLRGGVRGGDALNSLHLACLPPDIRLSCFGLNEATEICLEVVEEACYLRHGVSVGPDDVVMDIGANIGLFVVLLLTGGRRYNSESSSPLPSGCWRGAPGKIIAVEALPPVVDVLNTNVRRLVERGIALSGQVDCVHAAVSSGTRGSGGATQEFVFFPHMAGNSTGKPAEKAAQYERMTASLRDVAYSGQRRYECDLTTVEALMMDHKLNHLDLLKVDVEGMELEVLQGIGDGNWPKIRQIVVEVHDVGDRVRDVISLLRSKGGFNNVVVDPDVSPRQGGNVLDADKATDEGSTSPTAVPPEGNVYVYALRRTNYIQT